jgi:hypothetical protein
VGAGTVTLRIGTQLVGVRADTDATLARLRALLRHWIDDTQTGVPWVFDLRLEPAQQLDGNAAGRAPRSVPQLRVGPVLMARSRQPDDVLRALAGVLGGILARQDDTRVWSAMRAFASGDRIVLVDAQRPALSADPVLARAGVRELPTWNVEIDGLGVHVPPVLDHLDWAAGELDPPDAAMTIWQTAMLAGIVALDPRPHDHGSDPDPVRHSATPLDTSEAASLLKRFAVRHPSATWFSTVRHLVREGQVLATTERAVARQRLVELVRR